MNTSPQKRKSPRNYFSRREQLRLLILVALFGVVVLLMEQASHVENWYWLTGEEPAVAEPARETDKHDYDTSYQPTLPVIDPETVRIVSPHAAPQTVEQRYFPGVVTEYLRRVQDNRTHQHPEEASAWFNLWHVLANNESRMIDAASTGAVTFGQLFEQPEIFRGELVSLRGVAHRAEWVPAAKNNSAGVEGYYRLVLKLHNGPNRPLFLYILYLPKDFPEGDQIDAEIKTTGFFYKNWLYEANDLSWLAPVVLARDLSWQNPPLKTQGWPMAVLLAGLLGIILFSATIARMIYTRSKRFSPVLESRRNTAEAQARAISELDGIEQTPPPGEQLRELAAKEQLKER